MPGNGKKGTSSIVLCMRKVSVRSVQVLCINEVIATKKVTEKVKKWWKIAILWLFLSHRGCHMAPRPQKHEYLLATMFCTKFEHFRMSGSIICTQLFLSLTRCFKGTSFFGHRMIQVAPLTLAANLATRWHHLHWLRIWPPDGATCMS